MWRHVSEHLESNYWTCRVIWQKMWMHNTEHLKSSHSYRISGATHAFIKLWVPSSKLWFFDLWAKFSSVVTGAAQLQLGKRRNRRRNRCRSKHRCRSRLQTECDRVRFPLSHNRQEVAGLESHRVTSGRVWFPRGHRTYLVDVAISVQVPGPSKRPDVDIALWSFQCFCCCLHILYERNIL